MTTPPPTQANRLYYGDCLDIIKEHIPPKSVDLIYLDPPFNSNRKFSLIYHDQYGKPLKEQEQAFNDIWTLDAERRASIDRVLTMFASKVSQESASFWGALSKALEVSDSSMLSYTSYMAERLLMMKDILKPTGSIYLHCDTTASHYLKVILDMIFGNKNFHDEIIWQRAAGRAKGSQHEPKSFGRDVDSIFHYSVGRKYTHNGIFIPLTKDEMDKKFPKVDDEGRKYNTEVPIFRSKSMGPRPNLCYTYKGVTNPHPSGWRVSKEELKKLDNNGAIIWRGKQTPLRKSFAHDYKGKPMGCLWTDIPNVTGGSEHLGYPTQKPVKLLRRIIEASSNAGDTVFDPFCGCATTIEAAHRMNRNWIGCDIAVFAVNKVANDRLRDNLGLKDGKDFSVFGIPKSVEAAKALWQQDPYDFQKWANGEIGAANSKNKSGDGGVDGRLFFKVPSSRDCKKWQFGEGVGSEKDQFSMIIEVKGGANVGIKEIRELAGALNDPTEPAIMAGLIMLEEPQKLQMKKFTERMSKEKYIEINGKYIPRMQILTVKEILNGKRFNTPGDLLKIGVKAPVLPMGDKLI